MFKMFIRWIKKLLGIDGVNWRGLYIDYKLWSHFATPLERKRRELQWAEARVEIKNSEAYRKFKEWLVSWAFDYENAGRQATNFAERRKFDGSADACLDILNAIEFSSQIAAKTKETIATMELKEERKRNKK